MLSPVGSVHARSRKNENIMEPSLLAVATVAQSLACMVRSCYGGCDGSRFETSQHSSSFLSPSPQTPISGTSRSSLMLKAAKLKRGIMESAELSCDTAAVQKTCQNTAFAELAADLNTVLRRLAAGRGSPRKTGSLWFSASPRHNRAVLDSDDSSGDEGTPESPSPGPTPGESLEIFADALSRVPAALTELGDLREETIVAHKLCHACEHICARTKRKWVVKLISKVRSHILGSLKTQTVRIWSHNLSTFKENCVAERLEAQQYNARAVTKTLEFRVQALETALAKESAALEHAREALVAAGLEMAAHERFLRTLQRILRKLCSGVIGNLVSRWYGETRDAREMMLKEEISNSRSSALAAEQEARYLLERESSEWELQRKEQRAVSVRLIQRGIKRFQMQAAVAAVSAWSLQALGGQKMSGALFAAQEALLRANSRHAALMRDLEERLQHAQHALTASEARYRTTLDEQASELDSLNDQLEDTKGRSTRLIKASEERLHETQHTLAESEANLKSLQDKYLAAKQEGDMRVQRLQQELSDLTSAAAVAGDTALEEHAAVLREMERKVHQLQVQLETSASDARSACKALEQEHATNMRKSEAEIRRLQQELDAAQMNARIEHENLLRQHAAAIGTLESKVHSMEQAMAITESETRAAEKILEHENGVVVRDLETQLQRVQRQLDTAAGDTRASQKAAEIEHDAAIRELEGRLYDLQQTLTLSETAAAAAQAAAALEHTAAVTDLESRLSRMQQSLADKDAAQVVMLEEHQDAIQTLEKRIQDQQQIYLASEADARLAQQQARDEYVVVTRELKAQLNDAGQVLVKMEAAKAAGEKIVADMSAKVTTLQNEIQVLQGNLDQLNLTIQQETVARISAERALQSKVQDHATLEQELKKFKARSVQVASDSISALKAAHEDDIHDLQRQVGHLKSTIATMTENQNDTESSIRERLAASDAQRRSLREERDASLKAQMQLDHKVSQLALQNLENKKLALKFVKAACDSILSCRVTGCLQRWRQKWIIALSARLVHQSCELQDANRLLEFRNRLLMKVVMKKQLKQRIHAEFVKNVRDVYEAWKENCRGSLDVRGVLYQIAMVLQAHGFEMERPEQLSTQSVFQTLDAFATVLEENLAKVVQERNNVISENQKYQLQAEQIAKKIAAATAYHQRNKFSDKLDRLEMADSPFRFL